MSGGFPSWLWNMTYLQYLNLSYNHMTGAIINLSPNLSFLDLSNNFLQGPLPKHIRCLSLQFVFLHNNMLSGSIPSWLSHLDSINSIDLSFNRLTGKFFEENNGSSLLRSRHLRILDLSENELSGNVQLDNFVPNRGTNMYSLNLRRNRLSGQIPSELCSLSALTILDFAENRFTGRIPPCLGSLMSTKSYTLIDIAIVRETVKRRKEVLSGSSMAAEYVPIIDLSRNFLNGKIPEALTNLSNLMALNLSYNQFAGGIPQRIGNMKALVSLDLSNNHLSGTIPQSLSHLDWLESLNMSNNNLQGQIPTGNQLQTLDDPSIYTGNRGLCGFPLLDKCTNVPQATNEGEEREDDDNEEDKYEKLWLYLAIMGGVATGFWGVIGTLVLKKRWRRAYFCYVEDIMARCNWQ